MNRFGHSVRLGLAVLFGAAVWPHAVGLELNNHVISGGGGGSRTGRFLVDGSIGQPVAESVASVSPSAGLRSGFWPQVVRWLNVAPIAREDVMERRPGQGAHVLIRTLLGNDSATDLELLRFVEADVVSAGGGSILRDGPWIVYQPPSAAPPDAEDSFEYAVLDALGVVAHGTVRVRIAGVPAGGPPNALQVETVAGEQPTVRVRFQGVAGRVYQVQVAPNLTGPWTTSADLAAGADGGMLYIEPLTQGPRFFRIVEPPQP